MASWLDTTWCPVLSYTLALSITVLLGLSERRSAQAWVVGTIATVWIVTVFIAIWRVPERRRRYPPTAVVVVTLVCYAGARMISFHPVDAVLYRTDLVGARLGAVIELAIVSCVIGVTAWQAPTSRPRRSFSACR